MHFKNPPSREGNKGVQFTKGPKEEKIIITYDEHSGQMKVTQTTTVHETIDKIGAAVERCRLNKLEENSGDCMAEVILAEMADIQQATDTMKKYRDIMTSHVERYACMDGQLNVTEPEKSITVKPDPRSPESFKMDTVVDMPHAKIWRYKKFLQDGECAWIDSMEVPTEAPATAEVGINGEVSRVNSAGHSDNLRPIYNGFSTTVDALAIPLVYNRLVSLLNRFVPNYKIVMHEQMKLSLFQYNTSAAVTETATIDWSRFEQNPLADNFNPVLDASGKGKSINCILVTQAAASASGGGTLLFPNVDVTLRPEKGDAICYYEAYTVPSLESITVEEQLSQKLAASHGYTRHRMCPSTEGELRWATILV